MLDEIEVIIPAAGLATRMKPLSNTMSKAMIPVNGKPVIYYILNNLDKLKIVSRVVIVDGNTNDIRNFVRNRTWAFDIEFVNQEHATGPLDAIRLGTTKLEGNGGVMVWLGDTLIDNVTNYITDYALEHQDFLLTKSVDHHQDWCMVKNEDGKSTYHNKPDENLDDEAKALIGVYYFKNFQNYIKCLSVTKHDEKEISDLLQNNQYFDLIDIKDDWFDCGNMLNYTQTRAHYIQKSTRDMNGVIVDTFNGTITKFSKSNPKKIEKEKNWYKNVPYWIKPFIPTVYEDYKIGEMTMSWESGTALDDLLLYEDVKDDTWKLIIDRALDIIDQKFHGTTRVINLDQTSNKYMLVEKNLKRLPEIFELMTDLPLVNLQESDKEFITKTIEEFPYENKYTYYIHGDPHFGNILFDPTSFGFKFLDPRGDWYGSVTQGDPRYDIAKFAQSLYGMYPYIIGDSFSISGTEGLRISTNRNLEPLINHLFNRIASLGYDVDIIKKMVGILLITCIPFHTEDKWRCQGLFLRGLEILKENE